MKRRQIKRLTPVLAVLIFLLALGLLYRALGAYRFSDILQELAAFPTDRLARGAGLTVLTYLLLTLYDHLGIRYLGQSLPWRRISLAAFTSFAFTRTVGFSLLTGGGIRYRYYSFWGLSAGEVVRLMAFIAMTFGLGMATMGGLLLLIAAGSLPALPQIPLEMLRPIGALALAAVGALFVLLVRRRRPLQWHGWRLPLPTPRLALGQLLVGAADWTLTASVLYLLLPASDLSLPLFLQVYLLAQVAVMLSHVPGGLGVFEAAILLLLPQLPPPALFSALLVYRGIYFLLPFALALLLFGLHEVRRKRRPPLQ